MKVSNIKSMWMTGVFFYGPLEAYNKADKGMLNVEIAADFNKIRKFQQELVNKQNSEEEKKKQASMIKKVGFPERPLDQTRSGQQPVQPIIKKAIPPVKTIGTNPPMSLPPKVKSR